MDEPLFSLEMNENGACCYYSSSFNDHADDDDDDNRFIDNDTGVDPTQIR